MSKINDGLCPSGSESTIVSETIDQEKEPKELTPSVFNYKHKHYFLMTKL